MEEDKDRQKQYSPSEIEQKWQGVWDQNKTYSPDVSATKNPYYNLMMFPYPSAEGLHVGNMYAFTGADVYGRFQRMQGKDVLEPIGLDGFGIHSENYAIKVGKHPKEQANISEKNFYRQLRSIGNSFDWTRTLETYDPDYYRWTQWLFIQLFKAGLAYRKKAEVNWCPSCKTVLADEQVVQKLKTQISNLKTTTQNSKVIEASVGACERCGSTVEKRELEQWFFRITDYADRLLDGLTQIDWSEKVKVAQRLWIGKKTGINITYDIERSNETITVFTTRPDTNFGATFIALAPENELVLKITQPEKLSEVKSYIEKSKQKTDAEREAEGREKTGVFTGTYAINQLTGKKMPIWVSDFVLMGFGTGAVVGVPGHDKRDFEFASKFGLEIIRVVVGKDADSSKIEKIEQVQEEEGTMVNSGFLDGLDIHKATEKIMDYMEKKSYGKRETNYHLRDWLISRQRYWGPPIPMVFCSACANAGRSWFTENKVLTNKKEVLSSKYQVLSKEKIRNTKYVIHNTEMAGWFPVPESDLPVILPDVKDWKPIGTRSTSSGQSVKGPLANHPEFYKTKCPSCGGGATRETDVSDTFLDSSWYFLRYPSVQILNSKSEIQNKSQIQNSNEENLEFRNSNLELPWDPEITRRWLPVNMYIGGAEHSVLHLLYSRFVTMALHDLGYLEFEEPFSKFFAHGLIIKDGAKMSKSKGNVVVPDEYIAKYGADTLRCYLMFLGPYSDGGGFRDSGIEGMNKFVRRVWKLVSSTIDHNNVNLNKVSSSKYYVSSELEKQMNLTVKKVTEDIASFSYNTAIARIMEYYNALNKHYTEYKILNTKYCKTLVLLLAPFAPHMTEHLFQMLRNSKFDPSVSLGARIRNSKQEVFKSIHLEKWPKFDPEMLVSDTVTVVVQINGKRRGEIQVQSSKFKVQSEIEGKAREAVAKYLEGLTVKKIIYVPGKIVNFVV